MDLTTAVTIVSTYSGILTAVYITGLRSEVLTLRRARQEFHDRSVQRVAQLRGRAEFSLLNVVYEESPKLRELFQQSGSTSQSTKQPTGLDLEGVQKEISRITHGLRGVTEPRLQFDKICEDYEAQETSLKSAGNALVVMSLLVPISVIILTVAPMVDPALVLIFSVIYALMVLPFVTRSLETYTTSKCCQRRNERLFAQSVDEMICGPVPNNDEIPPADPPA
ncbi:MAG: hypothetical protein JRN54_04670 [Nitrososphaerota archaeon]|jgi:hypothetical protein|nr:hypothetical protein [Nitrososphaerota archaeon]